MKRTAILALTMVYMLSIFGMAVNRFYCCGKLASVKLINASVEHPDLKTGKNKDCCKNERHSFQLKDFHISSASLDFDVQMPVVLPDLTVLNYAAIVKILLVNQPYQGNAPPGYPEVPIYTLNCNYRI